MRGRPLQLLRDALLLLTGDTAAWRKLLRTSYLDYGEYLEPPRVKSAP
jgi:hypothetical protein